MPHLQERHFQRALKHRDKVRAVDTGPVVALVAPATAEDLAHVTGKPPALCAGVDDVAFRAWFHARKPVAPPLITLVSPLAAPLCFRRARGGSADA